MKPQFEAGGNMASWPANVPGKRTFAAVLGCLHLERGKCCEILWTAEFPDLEPALYWAAKKEVAAVRKDKWIIASRVVWQHDLAPERAVAECFKSVEPQLDHMLGQIAETESLENIDLGEGPMKAIKPEDAKQLYIELVPSDDPTADAAASFVAPGPFSMDWMKGLQESNDVPIMWTTDKRPKN